MMTSLVWVARVLGTLMVLLVAVIAIGEGVPPLAHLSGAESAQMAGMAVMALGLAAAWKWPVWGGLATLAGYAVFQGVEYSANGRLATGWPFTLFLVAGMLHVVSGWWRGAAAGQP